MKKIFVCVLALALLGLGMNMAAAREASAPEGFTTALENSALRLYVNPENGQVILEDRASGYLWRSNPEGNDSRAKGVHRQTLMSQLTVSYANERGTSLMLTSAADAVNAGGLAMAFGEDELTATYQFDKPRIRVTVVYRLAEDHLKVLVPVEGIESYPDEEGSANLNTVTAVDVLPLMGAGSTQDEGWLLVPDGSGALINFNNGVTSMMEYNANVYGKDHGVEGQIGLTGVLQAQARTVEQTARLPVFGTYRNDADGARALLGIVTQNDAKAAVLARVSNLTSYNYAWSRFRVRNAGSMMMNSKEFGASVIGVSEREGLTTGEYEVRYYPLADGEATTAGMAAAYREYLQTELGLTRRVDEGQYPLYLELYAQVKKPAQVLGIPYTKTHSLTTLSDAREVVSTIGVEQSVVRYAHWLPGGGYWKLPARAALPRALGDVKDLRALQEELAQKGGALYPAADLMNAYKGGNGFWAIRDAVLAPVNAPQLQFQQSYSSRAANPGVPPWYLLSPARYERFFGRFFDSYAQLGLPGLALDDAGEILTSDMRSHGGTGRGQVPGILRDVLQMSGKQLMLGGGNAYAAALASHLLSTPGGSSGYTITDSAIPFYQMVFHGMLPYGIGVANHSSDPRAFLLRCLEYGASPQFAFVGRDMEELADSRLSFLLSPDYRAWADEVKTGYEELRAVLAPLAALPITGHEALPFGARTEYGGQTAVYVNYTPEEARHMGLRVPPMGYLVTEVGNEQ